ncbi:alpha-mannosidase [Deinococcus peraridilitoris]|uniref:Alpha-mannosidase n=1 Tax=Deinococcus peraridilitoris (strain DSM 19664 / LMG 22246 / CIP 109416 / KR-200) TaxID=937777 RepID=K9ZXN4_DEIPD|nr:alpha-mannosidase [Deinococcus peraridilitoris]AFZ65657.1 alpha-mannosidase [Deinococcus peraridilitoris DSM 19664]
MTTSKDAVFHMIGNAHIDPVWLWNWQEGYQEIKATYRSALDRLQEHPDFIFTCSSAAHLAWIEANEPEMFEEIRARVQEGRWALVGGWWVQPDCNLPSGESFVRQGLYGQRFFQSRFGRVADTGYNPDSFGHAGTLPQILLKSGLTRYTFMRPGPHEQALPSRLFWWQGPDGSRVLTFRIPYEYCTWGKDLEPHVRKCTTELSGQLGELMCFYGVGNHGGGPTNENLASITRLNGTAELPELRLSDPSRYFDAVQHAQVPEWSGELQIHAVGCYAVHSGVKRWNRAAELALVRAEKFASLATALTGLPYPRADLERAWKRVLFNQFHDILAGTSIESAYEDARNEYGEALATAQHVTNAAIQRLSWRVTVPPVEGSRPYVVFNPHPWPVRIPIEHETGGVPNEFAVRDERGEEVPAQRVRSEATVTGWRKRLSWLVELPPFGHRRYTIVAQAPQDFAPCEASATHLENGLFRLDIDEQTGGLARLLDKRSGSDVFQDTAAVGHVIRDDSDTWSHGVFGYHDLVGRFADATSVLLDHGPVKSTIRTISRYASSTLTQEFSLFADLPYVEVRVRMDWHERHRVLKLHFPTHLHFPQATYEAPYGVTTRPTDGDEEPGQRWADLSGVYRPTGVIRGLSLINDAKYSYHALGSTLGLTVLRSPIIAHHDPYVPSEDGDYRFMDQGEQSFTYWIVPHEGTWREAGIPRAAATLTEHPVVIPETYHEGPLPAAASWLSVEPANVQVTVVKRAEEDHGYVLRLVETHGLTARAQLSLPFLKRETSFSMGAYEILTLLVPDDGGEIVTLNLTELETLKPA